MATQQEANTVACSAPAPEAVKDLAQRIAGLGWRAPAILLFETLRPLSFVGSQLLYMLEPFAPAGGSTRSAIHQYALLLEHRQNVNELLHCLETSCQPQPSVPAAALGATPNQEEA